MTRLLLLILALLPASFASAETCHPAVAGAPEVAALDAVRKQAGLPRLVYSSKLTESARALACDNARRHRMDHSDGAGRDLGRRLQRVGYKTCYGAENLAWGYRDIGKTMTSWMKSPPHRANLLSPKVREYGLAWMEGGGTMYWVLELGRPC